MLKRILTIALLSAVAISNTGCNGGGSFKKTLGIEYKIVKDAPGKNAAMGDIVEFNMLAKIDTTVLADTRKQGRPQPTRVEPIKEHGQWQAVLPMLSVGDSALVEVSCDTILKNIPADQLEHVPAWLKNGKGKKIMINISIVSIKSMDEYKKQREPEQMEMQQKMKEQSAQQLPVDDKILQDYFAKNNIKAQKTASGLYYTIAKPGSGAQITKGQSASMMYTGKTLDGKAFDSNVDSTIGHHGVAPLTFTVGANQMIPGVDEGIALLKKGAKATLYLPSPLGYGPANQGAIGPNSILIFDVEVVDVKTATMPKNMPTAAPAPGN